MLQTSDSYALFKKNMTRTILSLILVFYLLDSFGQKPQNFTISNEKNNFIYIGIENPLTAFADNCPCDSLILTTDNGSIKSYGNCFYSWTSSKAGTAILTLKKVIKNDTILIGTKQFYVKEIPDPIIYVANKTNGTINKSLLAASHGLIPSFAQLGDIDIYVPILSFKIVIVRDTSVLYVEDIKGNKLSGPSVKFITTLLKSDIVIFSQITVGWFDKPMTTRVLRPIEFTIE